MVRQLELFPDYPRLAPPPSVLPTPKDWTWLEEAWATLYYPEEDDEPMSQNTLQGNLITYIKSVLDSCATFFGDEGAFAAADLFMQRTVRALNPAGELTPRIEMLAPDVIFVRNVLPKAKRGSFDQQKEEKQMRDAWRAQTGEEMPDAQTKAQILVVEVMSPSNYADKGDLWKRYSFYQSEGVQEYLVVHTKDNKLYLEFFVNQGGVLLKLLDLPIHTSTLAQVSFTIENNELVMTTPQGDRFFYYEDERKMKQEAQKRLAETAEELAKKEAELAQREAELERERAEKERERAEKERERAEKEQERKLRFKLEEDFERERREEQRAMEELKHKLEEAQRLADRLNDLN